MDWFLKGLNYVCRSPPGSKLNVTSQTYSVTFHPDISIFYAIKFMMCAKEVILLNNKKTTKKIF